VIRRAPLEPFFVVDGCKDHAVEILSITFAP